MGDHAVEMNALQIEIEKRLAYLHLLEEFEKKHRAFLGAEPGGYFLNETDGALVFFAERRESLRNYFGQGWSLRNGAVEKSVDGITIRLLPDNGHFEREDVEI